MSGLDTSSGGPPETPPPRMHAAACMCKVYKVYLTGIREQAGMGGSAEKQLVGHRGRFESKGEGRHASSRP